MTKNTAVEYPVGARVRVIMTPPGLTNEFNRLHNKIGTVKYIVVDVKDNELIDVYYILKEVPYLFNQDYLMRVYDVSDSLLNTYKLGEQVKIKNGAAIVPQSPISWMGGMDRGVGVSGKVNKVGYTGKWPIYKVDTGLSFSYWLDENWLESVDPRVNDFWLHMKTLASKENIILLKAAVAVLSALIP